MVSRNIKYILEIIQSDSKEWVVKPLNRRSGEGVIWITGDECNIEQILKLSTHNEQEFVIVQEFLADVYQGDKRIFLVNGIPIGWMNRIPPPNDFRANIHLGATPEKCHLNNRDMEIIKRVSNELAKMDIPIACLDIIGGYLSEVNVTSPSGIPEINQITGKQHEGYIVDYLEIRANKFI